VACRLIYSHEILGIWISIPQTANGKTIVRAPGSLSGVPPFFLGFTTLWAHSAASPFAGSLCRHPRISTTTGRTSRLYSHTGTRLHRLVSPARSGILTPGTFWPTILPPKPQSAGIMSCRNLTKRAQRSRCMATFTANCSTYHYCLCQRYRFSQNSRNPRANFTSWVQSKTPGPYSDSWTPRCT
jgi:hypothetical protein